MLSCIICGWQNDPYQESHWSNEFRAVYTNSRGRSAITGVGRYQDAHTGFFAAPRSPSVRWDDSCYTPQAKIKIPVMAQGPENGRHGFVLHGACWCLLQKALAPEAIPVERLVLVCRSLPFPLHSEGLCWGHTYGGLLAFDDDEKDYYPWEDRLLSHYEVSETCAEENPYDVPEISDLLMAPSQKRHISVMQDQGHSCFTMLPWEIREAIATQLSLKDALSLLKSSKAFLPILTSQRFWASRFEPGNDRDFFFEKRNTRENRDWAALYEQTKIDNCPPGLKNRRRIWRLIQAMVPALKLQENGGFGISHRKLLINARKIEVTGDIIKKLTVCSRFEEGCCLFKTQRASVPSGLIMIAFSTVSTGPVGYIAGMRFISSDHEDICLGYINWGNELFHKLTAVQGFILATGSRGIRGIQVVAGNGVPSKWFGYPEDIPVTERLAAFEGVGALEVGIDGYKMVSLAVAESAPSEIHQSVASNLPLRTTGLWYPQVPDRDVYLNEESFTGEDPVTAGYQPLFWIQFGGPKGCYLRSLTQVSVDSWSCIEFHYNIGSIPKEKRKLGRHIPPQSKRKITRFSVDGPGGEVIESIDVSLEFSTSEDSYRFYKHGMLKSFKVCEIAWVCCFLTLTVACRPTANFCANVLGLEITTNHGRSKHFLPPETLVDESALTRLSITPGTTITGLYASQNTQCGLTSLGAMSEVVK